MVHYLAENETEKRKIRLFYAATRIEKRHSVVPDFGFFEENTISDLELFKEIRQDSAHPKREPSTAARLQIYKEKAQDLAQKAIKDAVGENFDFQSLTHLITVSCTGFYAPSWDIELIENLALKPEIERTHIGFMGCYAAFNALKIADYIVRTNPLAQVLVVNLELCTLHLQRSTEDEQLLAGAIFADGASAMLIGAKPLPNSLKIKRFYSELMPAGKSEMGWHIGDTGFEMQLSSQVAPLIAQNIAAILEKSPFAQTAFDEYAIHPGGKKILAVVEQGLHISDEQNRFAHQIWKNYGNMSSATIVFVWKLFLENYQNHTENISLLSMGFGPGLTVEMAEMERVS